MTNQQTTAPVRQVQQKVPVRTPLSRRRNPVRVHPAAESLERSIKTRTASGEKVQAAKSAPTGT